MLGRTLFRRVGALGMAISVGQAALVAREHWIRLAPHERARLQALVQKSGGRRSRLSDEERQEFADLVRKLELGRLGRRVAFSAMPFGGRR